MEILGRIPPIFCEGIGKSGKKCKPALHYGGAQKVHFLRYVGLEDFGDIQVRNANNANKK